MTATASRKQTNIASLRAGGKGSSGTSGPVSSGDRFKARMPGQFDGFREGSGDEKTGKLVEVTIIQAGVSLNGLDYLPETLKEAAPLFEGVPIYAFKFGKTIGDEAKLGHLPEQAKTRRGNFGNQVGSIKESWWDEGRKAIRGLVAIFDEATRTKLKNAFDQKLIGVGVKEPAFGLSIDAAGLKEGAGVTKIVRPESLDMVKKAAAGGGFDRIVAEATEEEEEMTVTTEAIQKLIEEAATANNATLLKMLKEQEDEGQPGGGGMDALSALRKMMEGASPEDQRALATRVLAMFKEMGLTEASPEERRAEAMTEAVKGLIESHSGKDPASLKEAMAKLVEDHAPEQESAEQVKIKEQGDLLRKMAMGHALDTLTLKEGRKFSDVQDAIKLADLSKVKVSEDFSKVEGLTEAMEELAEAKPYLLAPAGNLQESDEEKAKRLKEEAEGGAPAPKKPEPRGQEIRLTEEDDGRNGSPANIEALEAELAAIDGRMADFSAIDKDIVTRSQIKSQLRRARATA